tara:strand:- start:1562 stop:1690 length:129 start_codon:yes stop_codon:yes gene_type:complete
MNADKFPSYSEPEVPVTPVGPKKEQRQNVTLDEQEQRNVEIE